MDGQGQTDSSVNAPVAAGQGETAQPAPAQGVQVQPTPGQGETAQPAPANSAPASDKGPVPYDRFAEVNQRAKEAQDQVMQLQAQLTQAQSYLHHLAQQQQAQTQPAQPQTPLSKYKPEDMLDPAKQYEALHAIYGDMQRRLETAVQQIQLQNQTSDFDTLVGRNDPVTGAWVWSDVMTEAIRDNPSVLTRIQQMAGNPQAQRVFVYQTAEMQKQIRALRTKAQPNPTPSSPPVPPVQAVAQQIKAAQQSPVSISAATGTGQIDRANAVASMPQAEFQGRLARAKAGGSFW